MLPRRSAVPWAGGRHWNPARIAAATLMQAASSAPSSPREATRPGMKRVLVRVIFGIMGLAVLYGLILVVRDQTVRREDM